MRIVAFLDRLSRSVSTRTEKLAWRVIARMYGGLSGSMAARKQQYSETDYRLPFDFNINLKPLAERDFRSLSMSRGDKAC
jgi:hypothetical protein